MNVRTLRTVCVGLCRQPPVFLSRKNYLFVVSHMRSYSSLLCHILGSHGEIDGYAEMQQWYLGWPDLLRLRYNVYRTNDRQLGGRFVLDKILHNRYRLPKWLLHNPHTRVIFLLRQPEETLKSIIHMGQRFDAVDWYTDPHKGLDYYVKRLQRLELFARYTRQNAVFIESEHLIERTDTVLACLTSWLTLEHPLTPNYTTFTYTGVPKYGDPSERIKCGTIVKNVEAKSDIALPPNVVEQAREAYRACRAVLLDHCERADVSPHGVT